MSQALMDLQQHLVAHVRGAAKSRSAVEIARHMNGAFSAVWDMYLLCSKELVNG